MEKKRSALIAGATGLVGGHLLWQLCQDESYDHVIALVRRRPVPFSHPKLRQKLLDYAELKEDDSDLKADDVFCCLGTTIARAGSEERFRLVDYDFCLKVARLALKQGARKFLIITALGADPDSKVFYSRVKGETERDIRALGLPETHVFRPSLLEGERDESRPLERLALLISRPFGFLFKGRFARFRPVRVEEVAQAMLDAAKTGQPGYHVHESEQIRR